MRKSTATAIVARRLRVPDGRAEHLVQRASEAQLLPTASGSNVPDLGPHEIANVFLAVAVDRGLGSVGRTVSEFANLTGENGATFGDALAVLFSNGPALQRAVTGSMVIRLEPPSVSLTSPVLIPRKPRSRASSPSRAQSSKSRNGGFSISTALRTR